MQLYYSSKIYIYIYIYIYICLRELELLLHDQKTALELDLAEMNIFTVDENMKYAQIISPTVLLLKMTASLKYSNWFRQVLKTRSCSLCLKISASFIQIFIKMSF